MLHEIDRTERIIDAVRTRMSAPPPDASPEAVGAPDRADVLEELRNYMEELHAAEEELRQQNDELVAMRQDLEVSRERYRELFEFAPDAYIVTDNEGVIREANSACERIFGLRHDHLLNKPLTLYLEKDDWRRLSAILRRMRDTTWRSDIALEVHRRDGQVVPVVVALRAHVPRGATREVRWIIRDVSESAGREKDLVSTNEALAGAVAAREEFLGLISHELRTPITVILGDAEILGRADIRTNDEILEQVVADIRDEANRLNRIIENLLLLVRIGEGTETEAEPVSVHRVAERVANLHRARHSRRDVVVDVRGDVPIASGTEMYTEEVIQNLLSNADKYSPEGRAIEVTVSAVGDEVITEVRDYGKGVAGTDRERIFEAFYRAEETARGVPGMGVGLTVCQRLTQAQGGRLWLRPADGGGSVFGFALPVLKKNAG